MIPRVGNAHVQVGGNTSLSAKLMYCCTNAVSTSQDPPLRVEDATNTTTTNQQTIHQ